MPWHIQKRGKKFLVVKGHSGSKGGAVVGTHPSHDKAVKHLRALYAIEGDSSS